MIYLQIIAVCLGSSLTGLSFWMENDRYKKLVRNISLFILLVALIVTIIITVKDEHVKEKDRTDLLTNFDKTLRKGDTSIQKINSAIDSLTSIQKTTKKIIDNNIAQLKLQNDVIDTSRKLLEKSQNLLENQAYTYDHIDRLVNPFFPINIAVTIEIPLDDPNIFGFKSWAYDFKNAIDSNEVGMSGIDSNAFAITYEKGKIAKISGVIDTFKVNSKILNYLLDTTYISFYNGNVKNPLEVFSYPPQTNFALYSRGKYEIKGKEYLVDFKKKVLSIEVIYLNYDFDSYQYMIYGNKMGFNDIANSYITLNCFTSFSNFKISQIKFRKKGMGREYRIIFKSEEILNMGQYRLERVENFKKYNGGTNEIYIHKITSKDLYHWD